MRLLLVLVQFALLGLLSLGNGVKASDEDLSCPMFDCSDPGCTKTRPDYFMHHGKSCIGCPICADCPMVKCVAVTCDSWVSRAFVDRGHLCTGCPVCVSTP